MSNKETDTYMKKIRNRGSKTGAVMEKITQDALSELDDLRIQAKIDEVRSRSEESKAKTRQAQQGKIGYDKPNYLHSLFVGRSPEEVEQILEKLTPEKIQTLQLMSADPTQQAMLTQVLGKQTSGKEPSINDTIQLIQLITGMNRPNPVTLQGMAALIKSVKGEQKGSSMADAIAVLKPIYEAINQQSTKAYELHIKRLEAQSKNNPTIKQQVNQTKELAAAIGLTSNAKNPAYDLKLEEMRQSHDIGMAKLSWEQKLAFLKLEAESNKWDKVSETFSPILRMAAPEVRNAVRKFGESVGKSIGSGGKPEGSGGQPEIAKFTCPQCKSNLEVPLGNIPPNAAGEIQVKCPKCGTVSGATIEGGSPQGVPKGSPEEKSKGRLTYKSS